MFLKQFGEHTVWPQELSSDSVIVDLGANRGTFSNAMLDQFHCRCFAVEANPPLCDSIGPRAGLTVYNVAIAAQSGRIPLHVSGNLEASSILDQARGGGERTIEVEAMSLPDLLKLTKASRFDLIKFDIEGAEIAVLDSCPDDLITSIGQLTIEFHDFLQLTPPATVLRVVDRLEQLGFFPIKMWRHAWGDTLFVNRRLASATLAKLAWSRYATRNWWGLQRIIRRRRQPARALPQ